MASGRRPEHRAPPEIFYNEDEARKYTSNTRMIEIQEQLSERAIELLALPDHPCFILDIGCGSGLSGESLTNQDHTWIGLDISPSMLEVATEREVEGDLLQSDMGQGIPFRPGTFDGAISVSAVQWLCNADKKYHHPQKRLYKFFSTLYASLARGARAVMQMYPENSEQLELITQQAMKAGFSGGLVIDFPNSTKAKKIFLCLFAGGTTQELPQALGTEDSRQGQISYTDKRERVRQIRNSKAPKKSRQWIMEKKERRRKQGRSCRPDTKFTGRKRPNSF
ncbi:hypothetical protein CAPTEDRAFT_151499 [Capitella teleta]|uniref:18S rRNA (guanine-N(7))-methyltransferase n=1 Tax=Capitella teleta TaxID=283909 RepID=R7TTR2_CAPTE|nr:hypothetical protein CAPTEDRAFT_151499 [Capitella teleta]|eukprot:ELT97074.1 hypothetical protein CAPTEDRAFT_151499 [Capitella teleta]